MTYVKDVFGRDLPLFDKFFVGFDEQFNRIAKMHDTVSKSNPSYPPYNIRKVDDNKYCVEIACAGFSEEDLDIQVADGVMTVKGSAKDSKNSEYLFKGIGMRDFTRTFMINDHVEVVGASLVNGLLKIDLHQIIPEHKKPKKVAIGRTLDPKLLVE